MADPTAAGRKPESRNDPFEQVLIAGLSKAVIGIEKAIAFAEKTGEVAERERIRDYDMNLAIHQRSSEHSSAVQYLKAMAEITLAAAKLRGEFNHNHNYDVTRRIQKERAIDAVIVGEGVAEN